MADMASFDEQMPCVGIFWYDPDDNTLFGVRKKELTPQMVEEAAEKGKPFINYPQLHRQVWAKEYFRAQAKHLDTKFKLTSSLCWWASGPSPFKTSSPNCWSRSSPCRTSSSCTTSTGTWATVGVVICQSKCPANLEHPQAQVSTM